MVVWGSLPFFCPLLWPFSLCWPPTSIKNLHMYLGESVVKSSNCLKITWACSMSVPGLRSCSLFLCHCFAKFPPLCDSMWDGVTPPIPVWEVAVAGWCLPASPDSSRYFYGMNGNGVMPVWRAQDEPIKICGHHSAKRPWNSHLFSNHLRNSRTALLASERQHGHSWSWTHLRFLQHWHEEMHCDIQWWHLGWARLPISLPDLR